MHLNIGFPRSNLTWKQVHLGVNLLQWSNVVSIWKDWDISWVWCVYQLMIHVSSMETTSQFCGIQLFQIQCWKRKLQVLHITFCVKRFALMSGELLLLIPKKILQTFWPRILQLVWLDIEKCVCVYFIFFRKMMSMTRQTSEIQ